MRFFLSGRFRDLRLYFVRALTSPSVVVHKVWLLPQLIFSSSDTAAKICTTSQQTAWHMFIHFQKWQDLRESKLHPWGQLPELRDLHNAPLVRPSWSRRLQMYPNQPCESRAGVPLQSVEDHPLKRYQKVVTNHVHADIFSNSDEAGHSSQMQLELHGSNAFKLPMSSLIQSVLQNLHTLANHIGKINVTYGYIIVYKIPSWRRSTPFHAEHQSSFVLVHRSANPPNRFQPRLEGFMLNVDTFNSWLPMLPSGWNIWCFDIKNEETRYDKRTSILQTVEDHIPWLTSWMFTTGMTTTKRKRGALGISIHHGEWNSVWCQPGRVTSQLTKYTCCAANSCNPAFEHSNEFE